MRATSPILVDISNEFGITVAVAGTLGTAYFVPAAILALFFGPISDRYGRRSLIIAGLFILVLSSLASMLSPSFTILLLSRILSGLGAAAVAPAVFAAVGDFFPYDERGRAYAWLVSATTMAVVVGIPVGSLLAGAFSWRWMFGILSLVFLILSVLMVNKLPQESRPRDTEEAGITPFLAGFKKVLRNPSAIAALFASLLFGLFWNGWATYNGAFFIETLQISTENLAPIYTLQGLAILSASQIGGFLSDRFTKKSMAVLAMIACGFLIAVLSNFGNTLPLAILLNTIMVLPAGMRFVSGNALVSELVPSARGTLMAMNASSFDFGSLIGASLGSFILASSGDYGLVGISFGLSSILAGLVVLLFVVEAQKQKNSLQPEEVGR
jgi:multidrug resistance protein